MKGLRQIGGLIGLMLLASVLLPHRFLEAEERKTDRELHVMEYATTRDGVQFIHLPSGTYTVSKTISLPSNTVLEGEGINTVLKAVAPFKGSQLITNTDFLKGNTNIVLRSLKLESAIPFTTGYTPGTVRFENVENLKIEDVVMELDTINSGIDLASRIHNALIQRCNITNRGSGGAIMVRNAQRGPSNSVNGVIIRNNTLSSYMDEPLAAFGWMGVVTNVVMEKNYVDAHSASFGIAVFGIDQIGHTGRISDVTVSENTVLGGRIGGIAVKGGAKAVKVSSNLLSGQIGDGVFFHTGGNGLPGVSDIGVRANTISNVGRHCVFASGNAIAIEHNLLSDCKEAGIYVDGQMSVTANTIVRAKPGILVTTSERKTITKNTLRNAYGINVLDKNLSGVSGNRVHP